MNTAVILAAGMGTRLRDELADAPKGFIALGDRPIVEESVLRLQQVGVERVIIVTGFAAEHYQELAGRYPGLIETVHNPDFASSGSMYSLYCARQALEGEAFLLLASDLIYEPRALTSLLNHEQSDALLLSGLTGAGDEVYVQTHDGKLVGMSIHRDALGEQVTGELVGISKISRGLCSLMLSIAEDMLERSLMFDYETDCLVAAAHNWEIACPVIADLVWAEIDNPGHLERARTQIYPQIAR